MSDAQSIPIPVKSGVFISHITEEAPIAVLLQDYVRRAFGGALNVFVSSDKRSIEGGKAWWELIRHTLKHVKVVLLLLSDESVNRPWINYEAGVADGAGFLREAPTRVIPIAVKSFHFGKLGFPLRGFNGRPIADLENILYDISRETGLRWVGVDSAQFTEDLKNAEASLIYKNLVMRPLLKGSQVSFEISNQGNTDISLLYAEAILPNVIKSPTWNPTSFPNVVDVDYVPGLSGDALRVRYWSHAGDKIPRLPPVLTRSMKTVHLSYLKFVLKEPCTNEERLLNIRYQLFAHDYDTEQQSVTLSDLLKDI
jgi:hypothetical protein